MIPDSDALDQLHRHLADWQRYKGVATDDEINSVGGPDDAPIDVESLRRGRAAAQFSAKPQPSGDSPAPVMGDKSVGPVEPPPMPAPAGGSSPRSMVAKSVMGSGPLGYSAPVDTELRDLQAKGASDRRYGEIGKAVTAFTERPDPLTNFFQQKAGVRPVQPPHNAMWDNAGAEADKGIEDLQARRKSDSDMAASREKSDPNSSTANTYRTVLLKFAPDLADKLASATPAQMEKIAPWLESYAKDQKTTPPKPGDPLEQAKLDETIRHNKATEGIGDKRATKGQHGPASPVVAGKIDSIADPSERETVRAIVEGRAPAPAPGSKFGQHIMGLVAQVSPDFDSTRYGAYKDVKEKLAKSDEVVALNTAYSHVSRAKANIPDNFDAQSINRIKQAVATGAGSDKLTPFETDVKIAADELAKAYGNNSEAGRQTIEHLLAPAQSKAQLEARLAEVEELLAGKLGSYQHQYERVAPKGAAPFEVLSPENRKPAASDGREHKALSNGKHASRSPGGQWEVDD